MFCPEDGTEVPGWSLSSGAWYHPCPQCGTAWHYDVGGGVYRVEAVKPLELIPTLQALGLDLIFPSEPETGCPYCGQSGHTKGSCLEPADFEKGEPC